MRSLGIRETKRCYRLLNETGTSSQALLRSAWQQGFRLTGIAHHHPFNAHTLHGVPAAPPTDHHQQLPFSPSDLDHRSHGTTHLRRAEEGLFHKSRLDLADIPRFKLRLLSRYTAVHAIPLPLPLSTVPLATRSS